MSKFHSFCVNEAKDKGVYKAIVLHNIRHWLDHNLANKKNIHDGYVWTFNSASAFKKLFPYFSEKKIQRLLTEMVKDEHLMVANYNKAGYDRTRWYSMPEYAIAHEVVECEQSLTQNAANQAISQNCPMQRTKPSNALDKTVPPIPDINTDTNTDINIKNNIKNEISVIIPISPTDQTERSDELTKDNLDSMSFDDYFEGLWLCKPTRSGGNNKQQARKALTARLKDNHCRLDIVNGLIAYNAYCDATGSTGGPYVKQLSSFLGPNLHFQDEWLVPDHKPMQQQAGYAPVMTEKKRAAVRCGDINDYDW